MIPYAEASPKYYDREGFIYSFGVISNPPKRFKLKCMDDSSRYFLKSNKGYEMSGKGSDKVNPMINTLINKYDSLKN